MILLKATTKLVLLGLELINDISKSAGSLVITICAGNISLLPYMT
jgi:hypothetical protein